MFAGIGVLITLPVSVAAITAAYREMAGFGCPPAAPRGPVVIP
jgi:hypothetical protein